MYAAFTSICRLQALGAAEGCCYRASDDPGLSITERQNRVGVGAGVGGPCIARVWWDWEEEGMW